MEWLAAFAQVVLIDLVLAGDNAIIIGALAARLPSEQRGKVIFFGVAFAVIARIILSLGVVWLLKIPGVMLIGGGLLLWVCWKMWRDLCGNEAMDGGNDKRTPEGFWASLIAIALADLSMSLDNVLGVAGAARDHIPALVFGLILSMALMGGAAGLVAKLIDRHRWIAYGGLAMIVFVSAKMLWDGFDSAVILFA